MKAKTFDQILYAAIGGLTAATAFELPPTAKLVVAVTLATLVALKAKRSGGSAPPEAKWSGETIPIVEPPKEGP